MATVTRFNLDDILGNEVVDFQVLENNNEILGNNAAHLTLSNSYTNMQEVHRSSGGATAFQVRLDADPVGTPRLAINADGSLNWQGGSSITNVAGALTINANTLNVSAVRAGAGTPAAPSHSFTTDTTTGLYSPSNQILGIAVGGVESNRINSQGEIRFNRTNARIADGGADDPTTPGERLVSINALQVIPGRLHATGGASISTLQVNSTTVMSGTVTMQSTASVASTLTVSGAIRAYGGLINFEGSNVVNIQWRGDLGALYIPYGNGIYTVGMTVAGNANTTGTQTVGGRLVVGGYDAGWQVNFAAGTTGVITNGRFFQRGNGGYYCYDAGDFSYAVGIGGSQLVQRSPEGYIYANYVNMTANIAPGKPDYVVGMAGSDNFLRYWPRSALAPPATVIHLHSEAAVTPGGDGWTGDLCYITATVAGQWLVTSHATRRSVACGSRLNGGTHYGGYFWGLDRSGDTTNGWPAAGDWWQGFLNYGQSVGGSAARDSHGGNGMIYLEGWFIPTMDYPGN